jgi:hypothetical protein
MWLTAKANGFDGERSWDFFPPSFSKPAPPSRENMMKEINRLDCDLIFTITLTDKKSETRHVPGSLGLYGPFPGYGLQLRGFYSYWYPYAYDPGYYVTDKTDFMEGNLYRNWDLHSADDCLKVFQQGYKSPTDKEKVSSDKEPLKE